jgi:hypothetical protein
MRRLSFPLGTLFLLAAVACGGDDDGGGDDDDDTPDAAESATVEVSDDVDADTTWSADKTYVLKDHIFVTGGTLTIEAGTTIKGDTASSLVITQDARIDAQGTASAPIVFTSSKAEGARAPGDWGGVVLLGKAPINVDGGTEAVEGFPAGTAGTDYGGEDEDHDCGTITFARIEFAGFLLSEDNELNALTLAGCGADTTIDHVQAHLGADDGVEVFGGTVKITHLLVTQPDDDGLDSDFGWTGGAQFVIVQQNGIVGNIGFEWDSNKDEPDNTPRNLPEIWNATLIGSDAEPGAAGKLQGAMHIRRGSGAKISNTIVAYFADFAVNVSDFASADLAGDELTIDASYFYENANDANDGWPTGFDVAEDDAGKAGVCDGDACEDDCEEVVAQTGCFDEADFFTGVEGLTFGTDPELGDPKNLDAPDFAPGAGAPVLEGGETPPAGFDTDATFIGAIGTDDWTAGWTAYPAD